MPPNGATVKVNFSLLFGIMVCINQVSLTLAVMVKNLRFIGEIYLVDGSGFHNINFMIFNSRLGRGKLVLRHSVFRRIFEALFVPCLVLELNAALLP